MAITKKEYSDLKKEIDEIKASVDEINVVKRHEAYIEGDRKFKQKLVGVGATLGTLWTLILKFGDKLF